jgi:hypothetical protein
MEISELKNNIIKLFKVNREWEQKTKSKVDFVTQEYDCDTVYNAACDYIENTTDRPNFFNFVKEIKGWINYSNNVSNSYNPDSRVKVILEPIQATLEFMFQRRIANNQTKEVLHPTERKNYLPIQKYKVSALNEQMKSFILFESGKVEIKDLPIINGYFNQMINDISWLNVNDDCLKWIQSYGIENVLSLTLCNIYYSNFESCSKDIAGILLDYKYLNQMIFENYLDKTKSKDKVDYTAIVSGIGYKEHKKISA